MLCSNLDILKGKKKREKKKKRKETKKKKKERQKKRETKKKREKRDKKREEKKKKKEKKELKKLHLTDELLGNLYRPKTEPAKIRVALCPSFMFQYIP